MNTSRKIAATLAVVAGLGLAAALPISTQAQTPPPPPFAARGERHPELRRALRTLERTEADLRRANRDFGGHREKAADLCRQAEGQIQQALQSDKG